MEFSSVRYGTVIGTRMRRVAAAVPLLALVAGSGLTLAVSGAVPGQATRPAGAEATSTTAPGDPGPTPSDPDPTGPTSPSDPTTPPPTSGPGTTSTTTGPAASTTTTAPTVGSLPPADGAEDDDVGSSFGPQAPFDPRSKQTLPDRIAQAARDQGSADRALAAARAELDRARRAIADQQDQLAGLASSERQLLAAARQAQSLLVERAVTLYMVGGAASSVDLLGRADPSDIEIGMTMLGEVLDNLSVKARSFLASRDALSSSLRGQLDAGAGLDEHLREAEAGVSQADLVDQAAGWELQTYRDGSHVWIPGFVFPVLGPTRFDDSFGDARLSGTNEQHWHEGCDVVAAAGTPMVAVEDGVLTRYDSGDPLGGNAITLTGVSGYWYYYAHLSAFVPTLKQGDAVTAGEVIGYVGATGDALAPHLHFEVHDPGGQVLDSFGLLKAAWVARQAALWIGGDDPSNPPDPVSHPDPGTPAGFPRDAEGQPVPAAPGQVAPPPAPY
jgi:murein DD-endopeptidase MepM/ murein hydrolase activator NlpD